MSGSVDNMLIAITQEVGGIENLFDNLFSFLLRRTDFYYECDPGDKMGFPPTVNEKIVFKYFEKYQNEHYKKFPKKSLEEYKKKVENSKNRLQPEAKKEENITSNNNNELPKPTTINNKPSDISTYNGGETDKYIWSQNITDITIQIKLDSPLKGKDLDITFTHNHIKVFNKKDNTAILEGELDCTIRPDDSTWSLEDNILLLIILEKANENIWKTIIKGDKEIDTTKVDNTKNIDQFDDETQGALRKIVHEQRLKQMGLPTSEEEEKLNMLKKAWDSENSPFKGQQFDPNKVKIENGNIRFN